MRACPFQLEGGIEKRWSAGVRTDIIGPLPTPKQKAKRRHWGLREKDGELGEGPDIRREQRRTESDWRSQKDKKTKNKTISWTVQRVSTCGKGNNEPR